MPSFRLVDLSLSTPPAFDRSQKASFLLVGLAGCDKHMTQAELTYSMYFITSSSTIQLSHNVRKSYCRVQQHLYHRRAG